jgi:3-hydroxyisobutyrate dehydrogenase-like beta-hydroxyacid dehydrogenase
MNLPTLAFLGIGLMGRPMAAAFWSCAASACSTGISSRVAW